MLDNNVRYLQLAFNDDLRQVRSVLPRVVPDPRILIEAGTPFIKREGMQGVRALAKSWNGIVVADLKIADGAIGEVDLAAQAGARAITALGLAPVETLKLFIERCRQYEVLSMIDMLGVEDPLQVLRPLYTQPDIVVIHRGRDEESNRTKMIRYRHINRIRSKYDVFISAAGGVDLKESRSAVFNGANIVVVNFVKPDDPWGGLTIDEDITAISAKFLETIS
jgi:bifunctional enzyme Fae/Hps